MTRGFGETRPVFSTEMVLMEAIRALKISLGSELLILTHHYQRQEIVALGDYRGDSFGLAQKAAANREARFIVFCGVHFMAESAAILAQPQQIVQIPDLKAGCLMADMVDLEQVEMAWTELTETIAGETIVPIVYMNSDASLKAFCGRHGGLVCTSANARPAMAWGFGQGNKVFFFPDQHLGRNTGNLLGLKPEEMIVWNPEKPLGGNRPEDIRRARLILWDGHCHVHTRFQAEHVVKMKRPYRMPSWWCIPNAPRRSWLWPTPAAPRVSSSTTSTSRRLAPPSLWARRSTW